MMYYIITTSSHRIQMEKSMSQEKKYQVLYQTKINKIKFIHYTDEMVYIRNLDLPCT